MLDPSSDFAEFFQALIIVRAHSHVRTAFDQRDVELGYDLVHFVADPPAVAVRQRIDMAGGAANSWVVHILCTSTLFDCDSSDTHQVVDCAPKLIQLRLHDLAGDPLLREAWRQPDDTPVLRKEAALH